MSIYFASFNFITNLKKGLNLQIEIHGFLASIYNKEKVKKYYENFFLTCATSLNGNLQENDAKYHGVHVRKCFLFNSSW